MAKSSLREGQLRWALSPAKGATHVRKHEMYTFLKMYTFKMYTFLKCIRHVRALHITPDLCKAAPLVRASARCYHIMTSLCVTHMFWLRWHLS